MRAIDRNVKYIKDQKIIVVNGTKVIDLKNVPDKAQASLYSKVDFDHDGLQTYLTFNETRRPFDFHLFSLSPAGLIAAIVENRLEIEGMEVNENLRNAYEQVWKSSWLMPA